MQSVEFDPETEQELSALNDALTSIGSSPWVLAGGATILIGAIAFWIYYRRNGASRDVAIQQAAAAAGLHYASTDPEFSRVRMTLFGGEEAAIDNVVSKPYGDGTDVRSFEYILTRIVTTSVPDQEEYGRRTVQHRQRSGGRRCGGAAKISAFLPRMVISGEKTSRKLLDVVGAADIELESDEFNQMFDVRTTDRNFARAFLDARMIDFMVQTEGSVEFETFCDWIMLSLDRVAPSEMPAVCNLVAAFKTNLPKLIMADYPLPSAREELARPPAGFEPSHLGNAWRTS